MTDKIEKHCGENLLDTPNGAQGHKVQGLNIKIDIDKLSVRHKSYVAYTFEGYGSADENGNMMLNTASLYAPNLFEEEHDFSFRINDETEMKASITEVVAALKAYREQK